MTPRELMLENLVRHNSGLTDMFVMTIAMDGDTPIIQAFYDGRVEEGEPTPPSLDIGSNVMANLRKVMLSAPEEDEEEDNDGEDEGTLH